MNLLAERSLINVNLPNVFAFHTAFLEELLEDDNIELMHEKYGHKYRIGIDIFLRDIV